MGFSLSPWGTSPLEMQTLLDNVLVLPKKAPLFQKRHPRTPLCDIPSSCCFFTGPWTVTRSSLRMLRRVAAFCRPLRPVLLLVSFPRLRSPVVGVLGLLVSFARSRSPGVGVLGLCWMWHGVPFVRPPAPPATLPPLTGG